MTVMLRRTAATAVVAETGTVQIVTPSDAVAAPATARSRQDRFPRRSAVASARPLAADHQQAEEEGLGACVLSGGLGPGRSRSVAVYISELADRSEFSSLHVSPSSKNVAQSVVEATSHRLGNRVGCMPANV
jgi:hypothetical protein